MSNEWKPRRKFTDPQKLSRKVFDAHVDRVEQKRTRDRDDHRADMQALIKRLLNLETQLRLLTVRYENDHAIEVEPLEERDLRPFRHGSEGLE